MIRKLYRFDGVDGMPSGLRLGLLLVGKASVILLRALAAPARAWWRSYQAEAYLLDQPDHRLNDVGLTRAELEARLSGRPYL